MSVKSAIEFIKEFDIRTILSVSIICGALVLWVKADIQEETASMRSEFAAQARRTDKLYEIWVDGQKEINKLREEWLDSRKEWMKESKDFHERLLKIEMDRK